MKKLIILSLLLVVMDGQAQTFEGTMRWTMNLEITDPEMKARMAEAQRQLNDPETQAQMKEMEARMNDPEMKKMMEQNPQMKAAMEAAMKSGQSGGAPAGMDMMPKGMTIKMKGSNTVTLMEGGMADGMEVLHQNGKPPVRIHRKDKTYSIMPAGQNGPAPEVTVSKTTETMKILGYNCQKYLVEIKQNGEPMKQVLWVTPDIKDIDMKALANQRTGQGQPMFTDKVDGVPLKMEVSTPQGNMVMEAMEIKRGKLNDADFVIPAGFKEVKMEY